MDTKENKPAAQIKPPVLDPAAVDRVNASALAEVCEAVSPAAQTGFRKAVAEVPAAVVLLNRSERGRQALVDFKALLANGGRGLDSKNWAALATLCRAEGNGDLG